VRNIFIHCEARQLGDGVPEANKEEEEQRLEEER
jgi:hypothetical protein